VEAREAARFRGGEREDARRFCSPETQRHLVQLAGKILRGMERSGHFSHHDLPDLPLGRSGDQREAPSAVHPPKRQPGSDPVLPDRVRGPDHDERAVPDRLRDLHLSGPRLPVEHLADEADRVVRVGRELAQRPPALVPCEQVPEISPQSFYRLLVHLPPERGAGRWNSLGTARTFTHRRPRTPQGWRRSCNSLSLHPSQLLLVLEFLDVRP
jgi:hypothetical protein